MEPVEFGVSPTDDGDIIEDAEIIEELTDEYLYEEDSGMVSTPGTGSEVEEFEATRATRNPIATVTMAELYVSHGFTKRAFTIYRELLDADPHNIELKKRLYELKTAIDEDTTRARHNFQAGPQVMSEREVTTAAAFGSAASPVVKDTVLETLDKWLDAIKRRR
jgi:hypothetical protein